MKPSARIKTLIVVAGLAAAVIAGATYAFWSTAMEHVNELGSDTVSAEIKETFDKGAAPDGTVTKKVSFRNSGSASAFLRISYVESWTSGSGDEKQLLSNTSDGTDVAGKTWTEFFRDSKNWEKGSDGWYYYRKLLPPGESTENIMDSVTFPEYTGKYQEYGSADYELYFRMELLQASDSKSTLNSDEVNEQAGSTVFGRKASLDADGTVTWE